MAEKAKEIATAGNLMRMALALLDRAGEQASATACHLQAAIEASRGTEAVLDNGNLDSKPIVPMTKLTTNSAD